MKIIGIDPGIATIGLGTIEMTDPSHIRSTDWLTINTKPMPLPERLREIAHDLDAFLEETHPDLTVVERLFFARNERSAMEVAHARGVILSKAAYHGCPILEPTPLQLKLAMTGNGRATKEEMQRMLLHLLHLKEIPKPDDAADALALAFYGTLHPRLINPTALSNAGH
ncbi:crossover junction endodeoxyribonuclease RuvC [Candidatus Peregrinibacteria bacterium]|nr:crossover junction endodeoxyribonuclease RuvC [Candidatus Peregrinibacteria bacterium]MBI2523855.1 crossover junction endodeoxyribonuclease RuvC [Candidatus Peregrinibacteria bacterium]